MMHNKSRMAVQIFLTGFFVLGIVSGSVVFARQTGSSLPSEAKEAMNRGLAAAEQQEWELAIKYFSKAQKAAPTSPKALFNLALAYDSAGGHELITIAWYNAYLAALPDAANSKQVSARISILQDKVKNKIDILINFSLKAVNLLPIETTDPYIYAINAEMQARVGNFTGVQDLVIKMEKAAAIKKGKINLYGYDLVDADTAVSYAKIASAYENAGHHSNARVWFEKAIQLLYLQPPDDDRLFPHFAAVARFQAMAGDISGAKETAKQTKFNQQAYIYIYEAQLARGDFVGAKETAMDDIHTKDDSDHGERLRAIAVAQAEAGDIVGAKLTAAVISFPNSKSNAYAEISVIEDLPDDTIIRAIRAAELLTEQAKNPRQWKLNMVYTNFKYFLDSLKSKEPQLVVQVSITAARLLADEL